MLVIIQEITVVAKRYSETVKIVKETVHTYVYDIYCTSVISFDQVHIKCITLESTLGEKGNTLHIWEKHTHQIWHLFYNLIFGNFQHYNSKDYEV